MEAALRLRTLILAAIAGSGHCLPAMAEEAAAATITLSRHHTTNVLDAPLALPDSYTQLRGSLARTVEHELGTARISLTGQAKRHDRYSLEDDAQAAVSVETTVRPSDAFELRGTLSASFAEDGDEFFAGTTILETRTRKATLSAGLTGGIRIDEHTALVLGAVATAEEAGPTRFPSTGLPAIRFEPDRRRADLSATLTRTEGAFGYGVHVAAHLVRAEAAALLPALALARYTAKVQVAHAEPGGPTLGMAAGLQLLDVAAPAFRQLRPTLEAAANLPLGGRLGLRAAAHMGYELATQDDPVAAFVRHAEAAVSVKARERLTFSAGLLAARRDNIGLGGREHLRAAFAEARWDLAPRLSLSVRVDATRRLDVGSGALRRAVDTQVAITTAL